MLPNLENIMLINSLSRSNVPRAIVTSGLMFQVGKGFSSAKRSEQQSRQEVSQPTAAKPSTQG